MTSDQIKKAFRKTEQLGLGCCAQDLDVILQTACDGEPRIRLIWPNTPASSCFERSGQLRELMGYAAEFPRLLELREGVLQLMFEALDD